MASQTLTNIARVDEAATLHDPAPAHRHGQDRDHRGSPATRHLRDLDRARRRLLHALRAGTRRRAWEADEIRTVESRLDLPRLVAMGCDAPSSKPSSSPPRLSESRSSSADWDLRYGGSLTRAAPTAMVKPVMAVIALGADTLAYLSRRSSRRGSAAMVMTSRRRHPHRGLRRLSRLRHPRRRRAGEWDRRARHPRVRDGYRHGDAAKRCRAGPCRLVHRYLHGTGGARAHTTPTSWRLAPGSPETRTRSRSRGLARESFAGDRHARRVEKLAAIERKEHRWHVSALTSIPRSPRRSRRKRSARTVTSSSSLPRTSCRKPCSKPSVRC